MNVTRHGPDVTAVRRALRGVTHKRGRSETCKRKAIFPHTQILSNSCCLEAQPENLVVANEDGLRGVELLSKPLVMQA